MFLLLYYLLYLQSHTDIIVKIMICFLNRLEPQELSMYSAADMSHKSLSQSLQALIFAVLSWMTGRNLQILLFFQAQLLATPACYIGVIGSRAKKAAVFRRLIEEYNINEQDLNRIISPIGLEIKAETPAEIAISITGQMIQVRADRKATSK